MQRRRLHAVREECVKPTRKSNYDKRLVWSNEGATLDGLVPRKLDVTVQDRTVISTCNYCPIGSRLRPGFCIPALKSNVPNPASRWLTLPPTYPHS